MLYDSRKEVCMTLIAAATCAVALAATLGASAQQTQTTVTQTTTGEAKPISFTGCVGAGVEARSYVLNKVVPVTKTTETVGTSGATTTTTETSYVLVPAEKVEIQPHMGRKVEVTGVLIPAAETKTTTTTSRPDSSTTVTETTKAQMPRMQFRVTAIKELAQSCD
jgi:hypothetical protein